ncbi:MAG TPA: bifunctional folylpolyglutamate synthase/dihydrofolate synthase [Candidatus Pelagibacter sp.]|jgi:dihydrofolate synthase/folylpolyglutamate synthase|nr:bifunctional folylpolyglutamate synthase/dihydrofolate synthase [Candidatus Pelagibacter sp.]
MKKKQSRIENLISKFLLLHNRKIDLSLDRINRLNKDLKINLANLQSKTITVSGTNGKWSTAKTISSIFEAAGYKVDLFTSPHVQNYTERFVFESKEVSEEILFNLLSEVRLKNSSNPITVFELLTSAFYFYSATKSKSDIVIAENGLFQRYDSVASIGHHLMNVTCSIGLDHLDWLPDGKKNIDQIIIEKMSNINSSNIVVAKQSDSQVLNKIERKIKNNQANKIIFSKDYNYETNNSGFLYKDNFGSIQLPKPNLLGEHQISNTACAISAVRNLKNFKIKDEHIINGIRSIKNMRGRLQIIDKGPLKKIAPTNTILCDVAHNPSAGNVIKKYLDTLDKKKEIYMVCGMMKNKIHKEFISNFKIVNEILAIDIPNNNNCIKKEELKKIVEEIGIKARVSNSIKDAVKYIANKDKNSVIFIVGSIFLIGEVLNLS